MMVSNLVAISHREPTEPGNLPGGEILRGTGRPSCRPPVAQTNRIHRISANLTCLLPPHLENRNSPQWPCKSVRRWGFRSFAGQVRLPAPPLGSSYVAAAPERQPL